MGDAPQSPQLHSYVSIKKMAPYRETEWVIPSRVRKKGVKEIRENVRWHPSPRLQARCEVTRASQITKVYGPYVLEDGALTTTAKRARSTSSSWPPSPQGMMRGGRGSTRMAHPWPGPSGLHRKRNSSRL